MLRAQSNFDSQLPKQLGKEVHVLVKDEYPLDFWD